MVELQDKNVEATEIPKEEKRATNKSYLIVSHCDMRNKKQTNEKKYF